MTDVRERSDNRSGDRSNKQSGKRSDGTDLIRQAALVGDLIHAVGEELELNSFTATERLSEPFILIADITSPKRVDFLPHLGLGAGVKVDDVEAVRRFFFGRLFEARYLRQSGAGYHYQLTIRPWLSLFDLNLNTRAFQETTAIDVVKKVLSGQKIRVANQSSADQVRGYCNQYRESDFAFVSRLLEEDGYLYWFEHGETGEEMVVAAASSSARAIKGANEAFFRDVSHTEGRALSFWEWGERVLPVPNKVSLHDTHHLWDGAVVGPNLGEKAVEAKGGGPAHRSELFDFPGGGGGVNAKGEVTKRNTSLAEARLQAARAEQRRFTGEGDIFALACGAKFTLKEHPNAAWNQEYLIVGTTHSLSDQNYRSGEGGGEMLLSVEATPLSVPWRPALRSAKPVVAGPTTAVVIGPDGEVVNVDETGRVKVRFTWDRRTEGAKDSFGIWIRVSQGWAGGGYGFEAIPRIGTEVIVDFVDGDPDLPIITGRLHNKTLKPPLGLPGEKTKTTWKSQTVGENGQYPEAEEPPSGVGFNEIRMEDAGGKEEIFIHAQRDRKDWTRFDAATKVGRDLVDRTGRDRKTEVKRHDTLTVETGDQTHTVKAGSRKTVINKLEDLKVETGDMKTEVSMGNQETKVKMGNVTLKVDLGKIEMEAMQSITLKVGQSSVEINQMGVTIKGMMIKTDAQVMMEHKAGAMGTVNGGAMLTVKGGIVMIN